MTSRSTAFAPVLLLAAAAAMGEPGKVSKERISFKGKERVYFLYVPTGTAPERKLPLVLTLHGSGQEGETYVSAWKELAEKEKIVVVGPASNDSFSLLDYATRKIPYQIVIGSLDRIFPLDEVRATRDALKSRSFPVEYVEMSGQTHNYVRSAKEINGKAWAFLLKNPLPADPKYTAYSDPAK